MDAVSHLIRLARLEGTVDKRCLLAGRGMLDHPTRVPTEVPFHLLLEGACTLELADRVVELAAGDVVLLPRGQAHVIRGGTGRRRVVREERGTAFTTARTTGDGSVVDLFCGHYTFSPGAGDIVFASLPDVVHVALGSGADGQVRMLSTLMRGEANEERPGTAAILSSLCNVLLAMTLRAAPEQRLTDQAVWTGLADERLRAVTDAVLRDPGRGWTIAELADLASMSRATFIRHFTRSTGMSAGDFLTRIRMMTAAELLSATDHPVGTVAARVGYRSESAFGRAFRLATATTPAQFRRRALLPRASAAPTVSPTHLAR
jgi:AraC family transcriptional regulator, activator of mtrCDE